MTVEGHLAAAYEECRRLHRHHGRTYYLATRLLPTERRWHVHALYGFTRFADEIVDQTTDQPVAQRAARLREWRDAFLAGLDGRPVDAPILAAVLHTIAHYDMGRADFVAFLRSMEMDLAIENYATYADLLEYMEGSAAVIGTMMLPILEPTDAAAAREPARQLGLAFQLTNFIRDVAEDLDRGRIYLPLEDLDRFGVTIADLERARAEGRSGDPIRALVRFEVTRAREHYARAAPGVPLLSRRSQVCIRTAFHLYAGILDEIERRDFDVFSGRAVVPRHRLLRVVLRSLLTPTGRVVAMPGPAPVGAAMKPPSHLAPTAEDGH